MGLGVFLLKIDELILKIDKLINTALIIVMIFEVPGMS